MRQGGEGGESSSTPPLVCLRLLHAAARPTLRHHHSCSRRWSWGGAEWPFVRGSGIDS